MCPSSSRLAKEKHGGSTGQCTLGLYRDNGKKMETTVGARVYFPPILENQMETRMENEMETTEFRGYIGVYIGNNAPQPTHPKTAFLPPSPQRDTWEIPKTSKVGPLPNPKPQTLNPKPKDERLACCRVACPP